MHKNINNSYRNNNHKALEIKSNKAKRINTKKLTLCFYKRVKSIRPFYRKADKGSFWHRITERAELRGTEKAYTFKKSQYHSQHQ
jgi:hypothetical protein